jgi:hypothetical protein
MAPAMHRARMFGVTNWEQAAAIMVKGHELGLGLAASFEFIQVVMNKPALSPRGCLALIHQSNLVEVKIKESTSERCTVWMRRKDSGFEFECTWTMEDAEKAGVVKDNSGWKTYPANLIRWRAIGFCADVVCPDLIGGLKRADEFGAEIDGQGNVVDGEFTVQVPPSADPPIQAVTLDDLVTQYGADKVMEAAGGKIPATVDEVATVAAALAGSDA